MSLGNCILTKYSTDGGGYGKLELNGKMVKHHRLEYCKANNLKLEDIAGKVVMHLCDNPSCINPAHLKLGTHRDNTLDMFAKGRANTVVGAANGQSKLTDTQIAEIRSDRTSYQRELAAKYGVTRSLISMIQSGKIWKHV